MQKLMKLPAVLAAATIGLSLLAESAQAGLLFRRQAEEQLPQPSAVTPMTLGGPMLTLMPATPSLPTAGTVTKLQYDPNTATPLPVPPCLSYRHAGLRHVKCCLPPIQTCLTVTDPCTCCPMCIPVCLPGCCTDCPAVSSRHGLFAKGIVTYDYCCGVSVTVRFQRDGEVLVTYRGV